MSPLYALIPGILFCLGYGVLTRDGRDLLGDIWTIAKSYRPPWVRRKRERDVLKQGGIDPRMTEPPWTSRELMGYALLGTWFVALVQFRIGSLFGGGGPLSDKITNLAFYGTPIVFLAVLWAPFQVAVSIKHANKGHLVGLHRLRWTLLTWLSAAPEGLTESESLLVLFSQGRDIGTYSGTGVVSPSSWSSPAWLKVDQQSARRIGKVLEGFRSERLVYDGGETGVGERKYFLGGHQGAATTAATATTVPRPTDPLRELSFPHANENRVIAAGLPRSFREEVARALDVDAGVIGWLQSMPSVEEYLMTAHTPVDVIVLSPQVREVDAHGMALFVTRTSPGTAILMLRDDSSSKQMFSGGTHLWDVVDTSRGSDALRDAVQRAMGPRDPRPEMERTLEVSRTLAPDASEFSDPCFSCGQDTPPYKVLRQGSTTRSYHSCGREHRPIPPCDWWVNWRGLEVVDRWKIFYPENWGGGAAWSVTRMFEGEEEAGRSE